MNKNEVIQPYKHNQNQLLSVSSLKSSLAYAIQCMNQWILTPNTPKVSLLKWRFQPFSLDKSTSICHEKRTFLAFETLSNYQNQLKGVSSLKSSLANAIRCLNHWILAPTLVSGNYDYCSREGRFFFYRDGTNIRTGKFRFGSGAVRPDVIR